jgi:HlyD family secretion protein
MNAILNIPLVLTLGAVITSCAKPVSLKAVQAARTRVESTVNTTSSGTVEADQQAVLGFSTTGRVSRVRVRPGDRVKKGHTLAELENTDLQTISRDASTELGRTRELFSAGLVSKAALDEATKASEVARASLGRAVIQAPFDGLITEVNLEVGELPSAASNVTGGKAPIRIVDLKPRLIRGSVDEVDLAQIKAGAPARVKVPAVRAEPFAAEVTRVVPYVSTIKEQDRTSQVEFKITTPEVLANPLSLPVGASADVEIIVDARENVIAIPTRAILGPAGKRFAYIANEGKAKKAELKTGISNYERTEVLEGIPEGATVLLPPDDIELKDGLRITPEQQPWP